MTERRHNEPMPCGTRAAYKRGCRCEPCVTACREYDAAYRQRINAGKPSKPRLNPLNGPELIQEVEHLLMCGEGWHRILQATGYAPNSLEQRLRRAGRKDLIPKTLHMEHQMVWAA